MYELKLDMSDMGLLKAAAHTYLINREAQLKMCNQIETSVPTKEFFKHQYERAKYLVELLEKAEWKNDERKA